MPRPEQARRSKPRSCSGAFMHDPVYVLPRIPIPRTLANKGSVPSCGIHSAHRNITTPSTILSLSGRSCAEVHSAVNSEVRILVPLVQHGGASPRVPPLCGKEVFEL